MTDDTPAAKFDRYLSGVEADYRATGQQADAHQARRAERVRRAIMITALTGVGIGMLGGVAAAGRGMGWW